MQILHKFCNVFTQPNFFLCNANTAVVHQQSPIFLKLNVDYLKTIVITGLMEVDL